VSTRVAADPHAFPRTGALEPATTAIFAIDMQLDFCGDGGYMHRLGCDLAVLRAPIEPMRRVLAAARSRGFRVVHTREGYAADLADVQPWKRSPHPPKAEGRPNDPVKIGDPGPLGRALIRGEPGWDFVPELRPLPGEPVFDKPGYGVFAFTDVDAVLRKWGIQNLVLTGVTTDCCVHSVLREALDRGYDCLVLEDCVGASKPEYHAAALTLVRKASGVFGAVSNSRAFLDAIETASPAS
jgi:nicotinamidase-related amidase